MEYKIAVIGDLKVGKTSLCRRLEQGSMWSSSASGASVPQTTKMHQEFYFATYEPSLRDSIWKGAVDSSLSGSQSHVLKLIEPSGVDRSSLQPIIFRRVCGIYVVHDANVLWEEFLATDALDDEVGQADEMSRKPLGWQLFLDQSIKFWVRMALQGSQFTEMYSDAKFPVFAVFNKMDQLLATMNQNVKDMNRFKRRLDGSCVSLQEFCQKVSQFCCGSTACESLLNAGSSPRHANASVIRRASTMGDALEIRNWSFQSSGRFAGGSPLACDGCYFISCVDERDCPNRTHQIVNEMIDLLRRRISGVHEKNKKSQKRDQDAAPSKCCKVA